MNTLSELTWPNYSKIKTMSQIIINGTNVKHHQKAFISMVTVGDLFYSQTQKGKTTFYRIMINKLQKYRLTGFFLFIVEGSALLFFVSHTTVHYL